MRYRTRLAGVAASLAVAAVPGLAAAEAPAAPQRSEDAPSHCTFEVGSGQQHCFGSLAEATASAERRTADARDGEVVQATLFDEENYGGASFTIYGAGLCEKDGKVEYQLDLPDDWKNRVSSVQPWANCWVWLYPEPDLGGDRDGPFEENTGYVGDLMNDRAQSVGLS
ncbi:hypothetical protein ACL03H_16910 [Saccharopolyspora sp. MS10]|uniref:hypothetical protein n=1 Tax=Saccharopolyspora sp. MS10 TaxID=3385973 RepID=UPI00399F5CEF